MDMEAIYFDTTSAHINNQHTDDNIVLQESKIHKACLQHNKSSYVSVPYQMEGYPMSLNLPSLFSRRL